MPDGSGGEIAAALRRPGGRVKIPGDAGRRNVVEGDPAIIKAAEEGKGKRNGIGGYGIRCGNVLPGSAVIDLGGMPDCVTGQQHTPVIIIVDQQGHAILIGIEAGCQIFLHLHLHGQLAAGDGDGGRGQRRAMPQVAQRQAVAAFLWSSRAAAAVPDSGGREGGIGLAIPIVPRFKAGAVEEGFVAAASLWATTPA